jgi:hypothetical protein
MEKNGKRGIDLEPLAPAAKTSAKGVAAMGVGATFSGLRRSSKPFKYGDDEKIRG